MGWFENVHLCTQTSCKIIKIIKKTDIVFGFLGSSVWGQNEKDTREWGILTVFGFEDPL